MYQIINGKRYNTQSATKIADWDNGASTTDFTYCRERLYVKRTGEYFIAGESGPLSKYASHSGMNNSGWGEEIIPMTAEDAKEWAEKHMDAEDFDKVFEIPTEIPNMVSNKIKSLREQKGISQTVLAEKVGTTQQVIAQYESGQDMTITRFLEICEALGITAAEFLK